MVYSMESGRLKPWIHKETPPDPAVFLLLAQNCQNSGITQRIFAKTVRIFYLIFSRLHPVYTEAKFASKGGFLRYVNFLYKMFRKSLTCADFKYIICPVIRA